MQVVCPSDFFYRLYKHFPVLFCLGPIQVDFTISKIKFHDYVILQSASFTYLFYLYISIWCPLCFYCPLSQGNLASLYLVSLKFIFVLSFMFFNCLYFVSFIFIFVFLSFIFFKHPFFLCVIFIAKRPIYLLQSP